MKTNKVVFALLLLWLGLAFQLSAQQSDVSARFAEIRAKAEKWEAEARHNLGNCYRTGEGVAKDAPEAVKWYHKAAEQGHAGAQHNLGPAPVALVSA
jgi:TPR repeat protein